MWDDKITSLADKSGVTVTVEDVPSFSTATDASGKYSFNKLPYGIHDLRFTKTGYGTSKLLGISHAYHNSGSSTIVATKQLGQVSTTAISSFVITANTFNGVAGMSYKVSVSPAPSSLNRGFFRYFLSTSASVSNTDYTAYSPVKSILNNGAAGGLTLDDLVFLGFTSGQTVYIKMYGESVQSNDYLYPNTGKTVFPNLNANASPVLSFMVP